ncbi:hypothetical protein DKX38_026563 [Salix brachista]|uniref:Uncharacterized protein n=1 Tax=Salix brachista TaxID=2182728 RepID=A0A5N5JEY0_9ROSI|nr:hypothetical protein DKX38_026563 [Salix brachista]
MIDEYDDGSFDQLFERHRQETDDIGEAFTLVEKEIVKELLWLRINGAGRESSKSRSTSPPNAQVRCSYGKLPVIPKKKRSRGGDLGFLYPRKRPSSHDDDYEEEVEEAKGARNLTGFVNRNNHSKTRKKKGRKKGKRMINSSNRKRCSVLEDIDEEERARSSTSKRRKSESRALNLGFDFSDEIKALIGEDGDKDFKLKIRKKLFQTDTNAHNDHFTMTCLQINEDENLLVGAKKTRICHGDGIGVTLVELGLGDERDSTLTSQMRLKQNTAVLRRDDYVQIYSFQRNGELWLVLVKDSDHEEGRTDGKEIVKELLWLRINGAGRESSKSRSTSPPNAQVRCSYGKLPVIPKKKRSRGGDLGFLYPRKSPISYDDDYEEEEEEAEEAKCARILTGFVNRNNRSKSRKKKGRKKGKRMINSSNRKRCGGPEDVDEEERARSSTSKRRKSESRALNLGFDFSDEIKALIGEDGDKDFKLKIRKKLFQTDTNAHNDHFTMTCLQINEDENLLVGAKKTRICHGDGIGVTLVELGLGDERDSTLTSQMRLKQWDMTNTSCYALRSS